ncbi:MAG: sulfite exporter TauE/SafE family protein [Bdellovibrionales bacterium]
MDIFHLALLVVSVLAGGVAAVSGFGIGSLLTPLLALKLDTKLAVAVVSVPHLVATFTRFWILRHHIDRQVLIHFGILSAAGGLLGALLNANFHPSVLTLIFGFILTFAGFTGSTGLNEKFHFGPKMAWIMGALSGMLGGLVGNQGGIRSAALLGFKIDRNTFVGTATAIGVLVDLARMPIYFMNQGPALLAQTNFLIVATLGALIGTFFGIIVLKKLPERVFKRLVSFFILLLGIAMIYKGIFLS